jgi:IclR family transcriptional regulator, pca regulon regulatory protein
MNETAGSVKSATRVLDLLEMLAAAPQQVGVSEIARRLGIPKSSTHMLLSTLEARGYVIGDHDRRFHLNPIFTNEGRSWVGGSNVMLMRLAREPMESLAHVTGESSFLGVARDDSNVEYISKVVSSHEVRCDAELGQPRPMHSTSVGLVMLAFQAAEKTERFLLRGKLERVTSQTVSDPRQLRREIALVRERGYAVVSDTNSAGAAGVAAPIFDGNGMVIAALNVSAPTSRFDPVVKKAAQALVRAAAGLSRSLSRPSPKSTMARRTS